MSRRFSGRRGSTWMARAPRPASTFSSSHSSNEERPSQAEMPTQSQNEPREIQADAELPPSQPTQRQSFIRLYQNYIKLKNNDISGEFCMPHVAEPSHMTAPVHIDVGGSIYTTSMETLIVFPDSKIGMMFSGSIPIVLDTLKQHYFIDRDGAMFRHILNYLRNRRLILPHTFAEYDLLITEAEYFGLRQMVEDLVHWKAIRRMKLNIECNIRGGNISQQE